MKSHNFIPSLNIHKMRIGKLGISLLIVISLLFFFIAYNKGIHEDVNGDFYIYYKGGRNFFDNKPIYTQGLQDGGFTYPPFAAMFFQIFALVPFHTSAILFSYLINFILWISSFFIVYKILKELFPQKNCSIPLMLALICSARFYWHNFIWVQANMPVLNLTLLGILFYLRGKYSMSYVCLLAGTFLKITPVIFLICIALQRGYKDWSKIILLSLPFIFLPFIFRGFERGIQDWVDYYHAFLQPFAKGQIDADLISLGIPSFLAKLNTGNQLLGIKPILHFSQINLKLLITLLQIILITGFFGKIIYTVLKNKNQKFTGIDFCLMFLVALLIPGRVWEHHHVSTSFIYAYLFTLLSFHGYKKTKYILLSLCFFVGIIGQDTVGSTLYNLSQFYCFITILMIIITFLIIFLSNNSELPAS